jgi:hypothetical protein
MSSLNVSIVCKELFMMASAEHYSAYRVGSSCRRVSQMLLHAKINKLNWNVITLFQDERLVHPELP